jgi:hypothetical protein
LKKERVSSGEPAGSRLVVPCTETDEVCVRVAGRPPAKPTGRSNVTSLSASTSPKAL